VSSKKTPKEMFDALTRLYEGKNINRKMNLRTQLKNTRMQKGESIQEYFSRISQFQEQLEAIGDTIDEDELVMIALNGLVDHPFSNGGQLMCHEYASPDAILLKTVLVLLGHLMLQQTFCKRNFRTPAWVDNVISLHGS
jgi:hypothetical protein